MAPRTPRERSGALLCPRDERGRLQPLDAFERFRQKCRFEPETGCVIWTGGRTTGRGHNVPYGAFKFEGRRWFAHRWAAKFIHGFDIEGLQVDHCCPNVALPNTLCVQHLRPITGELNRHLQTARRRKFIHLQVGLLSYEDVYGPDAAPVDEVDIPFFNPPAWLVGDQGVTHADCPF